MIYFGRLKGNTLKVSTGKYNYDNLRREMLEAYQDSMDAANGFARQMVMLGNSIVGYADRMATENPGIFDGCEEVVHDRQELIDLLSGSRSARSFKNRGFLRPRGLVSTLFDYIGQTADNGLNFVKNTITGHPYDAITDLTDIVSDTTALGIEIGNKPAEYLIAGGAATASLIIDAAQKGGSPYTCECKDGIMNWIGQLAQTCANPVKGANDFLMAGTKSFADQMMYNWDTFKVGAVTGTVFGGVITGVEKGVVNSAVNIIDSAAASFNSLRQTCPVSGEQFIPEPLIHACENVSKIGDVLRDAQELAKLTGELFADGMTEAGAREIQGRISEKLSYARSKWDQMGLGSAAALLPKPGNEQDILNMKAQLITAMNQSQALVKTMVAELQYAAKALESNLETMKCPKQDKN